MVNMYFPNNYLQITFNMVYGTDIQNSVIKQEFNSA